MLEKGYSPSEKAFSLHPENIQLLLTCFNQQEKYDSLIDGVAKTDGGNYKLPIAKLQSFFSNDAKTIKEHYEHKFHQIFADYIPLKNLYAVGNLETR